MNSLTWRFCSLCWSICSSALVRLSRGEICALAWILIYRIGFGWEGMRPEGWSRDKNVRLHFDFGGLCGC